MVGWPTRDNLFCVAPDLPCTVVDYRHQDQKLCKRSRAKLAAFDLDTLGSTGKMHAPPVSSDSTVRQLK